MTAPDAVEAAARADWERYPMRKAWADISPEARENARAYIRPILAAAAPLIAQQTLLDAVQIVQSCNNATDEMCEVIQEASDALTARAATLTPKENP